MEREKFAAEGVGLLDLEELSDDDDGEEGAVGVKRIWTHGA